MTAQPGRPQPAFTAGELAPSLLERKDLKYYRTGAVTMRNVEVLPQGGFRQAMGLRLTGPLRRQVNGADYSTAVLTAPNGGTAANIRDTDASTLLTTGAVSGVGPIVICTVTFGGAGAIVAVDVNNFSTTSGGTLAVQYFDGVAWQNLAGTKALSTASRSRRFAAAPGAAALSAQWRVVALNMTGAGTISIGQVLFYTDGGSYLGTRLRSFASADGLTTVHVFSPFHVDVFSTTGGWVDAYGIPHPPDPLAALKTVQQLDTLLAFHQDVPPHRVLRQGSDSEWQSASAPLTNIPLHDYGGVYVNGVSAKWEIRFVGEPNNATSLTFHYIATLNSAETTVLQFADTGGGAPDYAAFCATLKAALEALPDVHPGLTVTTTTVSGQPFFQVKFDGVGNSGDDWVLSFRCTDKSDIACPCYRVIKGVAAGEPIISASRGWPRCGTLFQQRLLMGGLKSLPNVWVASPTGSYYDLQTGNVSATGAMLVPMDSTGGETIEEMIAGRSLLICTSLAEYFIADRTISKSAPPNHVETSRHGIAAGVPSCENEGSAVFVQRSGGVLYEFRYDDVGQTFITQNMSILASHLVKDVRDTALMRATRDNDANRLHVVLSSGAGRIFSLLREQNVTAGTQRQTPGSFIATASGTDNVMSTIIERTVSGAPVRFLERFEQDQLLDQAITVTLSPPGTTVIGLAPYFEGQQVWALADDDVLGPYTVTGGTITLDQVATNVTIGRWIAPLVETMPVPRDVAPGIVIERKARIHTVRLSLFETTSLAVGANGGKIYDIPLFRFGDTLDVPALQHKFTGVVKIQGLTGYADAPTVVITQKRPGFLHVRGITVEADL